MKDMITKVEYIRDKQLKKVYPVLKKPAQNSNNDNKNKAKANDTTDKKEE